MNQRVLLCNSGNAEHLLSRVVMSAVNYERNKAWLVGCPHIRVLDLALVFRVIVDESDERVSSALVTEQLVAMWHLDVPALRIKAEENMDRMGAVVVTPMADLIDELTGDTPVDIDASSWDVPLYVLSNARRMDGAVGMFCKDALAEMARQVGADLYILPSSVHEVILMPRTEDVDLDYLQGVVNRVNEEYVEEEDVLSGHIYLYDAKKGRISIAA